LWLAVRRRDDQTHAAKIFLTTGALACAALVPYALLLARRAATMDKVQALKFTHAPDLFRVPEIVALLALAVLAVGVWRKRFDTHDTPFLFAASFALTPFVVFNQQLVTGRSLQPVHYADYVLNYLALVALTLAVALFVRRRDRRDTATPGHRPETPGHPPETRARSLALRRFQRVFLCIALAAYAWAAFELIATTRRFAPVNRARDAQAGVASRLAEMARTGAADPVRARPVVFTTSFMLADNLPVGAPQTAVLWAPHMHVYSGLTSDEHKERIYQFLYYTGVAPENFRAYLDANPLLLYMLLGAERVLPRLTTGHAPLTAGELDDAGRAYANYVAVFTREQAARPVLSFVVISPERPHDLSQLDRWYERDAGERVGGYTIQRVRLRP
ncbi:MAG TPA: hypothetical protein VGB05_08430, partial [Pyrinomonadaceae bacterium]